jgi:hypothetical protein
VSCSGHCLLWRSSWGYGGAAHGEDLLGLQTLEDLLEGYDDVASRVVLRVSTHSMENLMIYI